MDKSSSQNHKKNRMWVRILLHLLAMIVLAGVFFWLTFVMLKSCTRHGKEHEMPDLRGLTTEEVKQQYGKDYGFILIDSIYSKTEKPGSIVQQDPLPGSKVKHGRNVYYIIVAKNPEPTKMPNLNNLSLRQAIVLLESSGLEVEELKYVDHFARNAICEQRYEGAIIQPETVLVKGSKITLFVGLGSDKNNTKMPSLYGLPVSEVKRTLNIAGLNLGEETFEDQDSIQYMKVYRTDPPLRQSSVKPGTFVKVWYKSSRTYDFDKEKKNNESQEAPKAPEQPKPATDTTSVSTPTTTSSSALEEENEDEY